MTITYKDIEFEVEFDYQPEEKEVHYYRDGSGHPGCPASVELTSAIHNGNDFMELLSDTAIEEIEELILELKDSDFDEPDCDSQFDSYHDED